MFNFQELSNTKKILLIAGFFLVCMAIGLTIYWLFFLPTPPTSIEPTTGIKPGELPVSGERPIGEEQLPTNVEIPTITPPITQVEPFEPSATVSEIANGGITRVNTLIQEKNNHLSIDSTGNNLLSYNSDTGEFYRLTSDGEKISLTADKFYGVQDIAWAPKSEKAILEFPDGSNIFYDFKTDRQVTLPKDWTEFNFNSTESQIAFKDMNANTQKRFLAISNPDGSAQKYLEHLGTQANKVTVQWSPTNNIVGTFNDSSTYDFSKIYLIGTNQENFRAIDINGYNVDYQYNPSGSHIVYSAQNRQSEHKPLLHIVEASGDRIGYNNISLNLNTWADKCTFQNNTTMYCAVPKELPTGSGWVRELADNVGDYIYRVDLASGSVSFVAEPQYEYNIEQIQVSTDGSILYFTDKYSGNLHSIKLK